MKSFKQHILEKLKISPNKEVHTKDTYNVILEEYLSWYFNLVSFYNQAKDNCPIPGTWDYLIPSDFKTEKEVIDFLKEHDDDIVTIHEYPGQGGITWLSYTIDGIDFEDGLEKNEKVPEQIKEY
jgi:hypothetical protein